MLITRLGRLTNRAYTLRGAVYLSVTPSPAPPNLTGPPHKMASTSAAQSQPQAQTRTRQQPQSQTQSQPRSPSPRKPRAVDIHELNAIEREAALDEAPTAQGGVLEPEAETEVDLHEGQSSENVTFTDLPLSEILAGKQKYGSSIHAVNDTDKISAAMEIIKLYNIGAVLVRRANSDEIVGIISTRDYIDKVGEGLDPLNSSVREFMTESPVFAYSDEKAIPCLELMTKHNFRHLPVRDRKTKKPIGLVSIGDLVRNMLRQYRESNVFLKDYIDGKYH